VATWAFRHHSSFGVPCNYSHIGDGDSADAFFLALNGGCGRPTFRSVIKGRDELPNLHGRFRKFSKLVEPEP